MQQNQQLIKEIAAIGNLKTITAQEKIQDCIEKYLSYDEEILLADGFEDAFVGIGRRMGSNAFAIYDREKCIEILCSNDGMEAEEAEEYFEFNVAGAQVGDSTPAFIHMA